MNIQSRIQHQNCKQLVLFRRERFLLNPLELLNKRSSIGIKHYGMCVCDPACIWVNNLQFIGIM